MTATTSSYLMPSEAREPAWDFSPVYDLINSLSQKHGLPAAENSHPAPPDSSQDAISNPKSVAFEALGNFDRVFDFLGVQRDAPAPTIPTFEASSVTQRADAYASDGALYYPQSSKGGIWHDSSEGHDHAETQEDDERPKPLTKTQKKRAGRQARKRAEALLNHGNDVASVAVPDTHVLEDENSGIIPKKEAFEKNYTSPSTSPRDWKPAKAYWKDQLGMSEGLLEHRKQLKKVVRDVFSEDEAPSTPTALKKRLSVESNTVKAPSKRDLRQHLTTKDDTSSKSHVTSSVGEVPAPALQNGIEKYPNTPKTNMTTLAIASVQDSLKKTWPPAKPFRAQLNNLLSQNISSYPNAAVASENEAHATLYPHRRHHKILPLQNSTSLDRNWSLLIKLMRNFPEDRNTLLSPLQLSINRPQPNGIHVFVDASNILIGFQDHLKRIRGIPTTAHVPRTDLAFHSLALLLERRRPIAKRVLAGSTPEIPAFEEARQIGYETNILDKVLKSKDLTERQRKFASHTRVRGTGGGGGASAGDETDNPYGAGYAAPPKWHEQAVDEILHLKILESIVDVAAAGAAMAPTMVLATGDAAEAEYSGGFLRQAERALTSGWNVELVSWGANIGQAYRKWARAGKKGFKIIELDEYAEELFGASDAVS